MTKQFDLIVIGVGMAGLNIARRSRAAGWEVAVIDSRPYGGTCVLRGCDPKKVLVGAAELVDWHRRMNGHGVSASEVRIDWADLMRFKRTFTDSPPAQIEKSLQKAGIETLYGGARFVDETSLQLNGEILTGKHIVVATGARPRDLGIPGEELMATSTDFLELEKLPERIVFVGGGYISFEFAHIAARAGAQVTIVHRHQQPIEGFDTDLVNELVAASTAIGIKILLDTEVTTIENNGSQFFVQTGAGSTLKADLVVHGAGRVPEIDDLDLESAGIVYNQRGIVVNEYLQSVSNPSVYAAGDAAATNGMPLTPVAVTEAHVVASNLLNGNQRTPDYTGVPSVVFTIPALAKAGLTEDEARHQELAFIVKHQNTANWYSARRTNETHSAFKVLIEDETGRILGAHLLSDHAGEVINMFALAIRNNITASEIKKTVFVHPAESSDISYMV